MKLVYRHPKDGGVFITTSFQCEPSQILLKEQDFYKIIWCRSDSTQVSIDGYKVTLTTNDVLFCTPNNVVEVPQNNSGIIFYVFNREFYCIQENDSEVSCMGLLFYGSSTIPILHLPKDAVKSFEAIHHLLIEEYKVRDHIQGEMLNILLKRLLISSTRLLAKSELDPETSHKHIELIRQYNILVEKHFKEKHQVHDYAELLYKSPKTLSNFFKKNGAPSPLKIINDRITAEAKRLLLYSDKQAEEIAYELGYHEPSHFSKFFKNQTGMSPLSFRKKRNEILV
jgi:AraC-like DNA-binding protein